MVKHILTITLNKISVDIPISDEELKLPSEEFVFRILIPAFKAVKFKMGLSDAPKL